MIKRESVFNPIPMSPEEIQTIARETTRTKYERALSEQPVLPHIARKAIEAFQHFLHPQQ